MIGMMKMRAVVLLSIISLVITILVFGNFNSSAPPRLENREIGSDELQYLKDDQKIVRQKIRDKIVSVNSPETLTLLSHGRQNYTSPIRITKPNPETTADSLKTSSINQSNKVNNQQKYKPEKLDKVDYFTTIINNLFDDADVAQLYNPIKYQETGGYRQPMFLDDTNRRSPLYNSMSKKYVKKSSMGNIGDLDFDQILFSQDKKSRQKFKKASFTGANKPNRGELHRDQSKSVWVKEQMKRKRQLRRACENYNINNNVKQLFNKKDALSNLLVDDKHKAIYCYIPKIACTQWKRLMMVLTGTSNTMYPENIPHIRAHFMSGLSTLSSEKFSKKDVIYRLENYTKFMFVRHPLERLLSAFKDKFETNSPDAANFKKIYAVRMMKLTRNAKSIPPSGDGIEFWEFLNFLTRANPLYFQEHWALFNNLCHPCVIDYDFIGKYDSIETDSNYILDEIEAPQVLTFPEFKVSKTKDLLLSYLNSVPKEIIKKVQQVFALDFDMFGYEKNS